MIFWPRLPAIASALLVFGLCAHDLARAMPRVEQAPIPEFKPRPLLPGPLLCWRYEEKGLLPEAKGFAMGWLTVTETDQERGLALLESKRGRWMLIRDFGHESACILAEGIIQ